MNNREIARILFEIGEYLEMQNVPFKPRAYARAASVIEGLKEDLSGIYERGGLEAIEAIPGVGKSIAEKIETLIKTGRLPYYEKLKKEMPVDLSELLSVEGLGPKRVKELYRRLKIKNIDELALAARQGKLRKLEGFGEKTEKNILKGIEFVKKSGKRFILGWLMPEIRIIENRLKDLKDVQLVEVAGSVRRRKETIGDIDILVAAEKPGSVMDYFVSMEEVDYVYAKGKTRSSVRLKSGIDVDLRVVNPESYGAALLYFTGSKDHNIALRKLALEKNLKLNEYGLFSGIRRVAGATEEEIYRKLGLVYIPPELREDAGEIEAARAGELPALIGYNDLRGDLQIQTTWSDGVNSIEEYVEAALKMGLEYIAITDHTKQLAVAHGLDEKRIKEQWKEIDKLNSKLKMRNLKFRILKGTECDILKDGSLDLPDEILAQMDVVGASVHSHFNLSREEQTRRIIRAMENKNVDIIYHPTCRLINRREEIEIDIDAIIRAAKRTGTILEINAYPDRLDLKDEYIRKCVMSGVRLSVGSDAHSIEHLSYLEWGLAQARRGWAKRTDIVNAWPLRQTLGYLKDKNNNL